ncbi:hypothetical protein BDV3_001862 [Batrachochytrium dendrobatidis]|nr:hypothetical protein O5D80_007542 [Batrachochytrium dendrobatidis]KAK5666426.1 hypothetical protein QVD99_007182 [Batrachochytrium dendrobatidis]
MAAGLPLLRTRLFGAGRRLLSTEASVPPLSAVQRPVIVRQVGYVRGGMFGFLLGVAVSSGVAYGYLLDDYQQSTTSLLAGVDNVQLSANKIKSQTSKIEVLEKELKSATKSYSTKKEFENLRNELLKAIDDVHVSHLELKTQVWEKLSKE